MVTAMFMVDIILVPEFLVRGKMTITYGTVKQILSGTYPIEFYVEYMKRNH